MKIRVVSIISRMNVGGPAILLTDLLEHSPSETFEHILITGKCEGNETDYLASNPLAIEVIYINDIQRSIFLIKDIKAFLKLFFALKRIKPDIVHTHTSKAGAIGRLATLLACPSTRIVHTFHGHLLHSYFKPWKIRLIVLLERTLAKFSERLIAVSNQTKGDLVAAGVGRENDWEVIHPGIRYKEKRGKKEIAKECFQVTWIGRFTKVKDPILALEAFAKVTSNSGDKYKLTMAGDGELLGECKIFASTLGLNVDFLGWTSNVSDLLSESDLLLFTSRNEGFGMVVVEAALQKVPTISTDSGGVRDFITHSHTGLLVRDNPESLASAIIEMKLDNNKRKKLGSNAYELAVAEYSADNYNKKHFNLYKSIID